MHSYPYFSWLSTAGFVLELILAAVILWKRQERNWPSLLALAFTDLAAGIVLSRFHHRSPTYFYTYYASYFVDTLLRLWVLHDVLRSFPGPAFTQQFLHWVTAAGGAVMAAGCWCMAAIISGELPNVVRLAVTYFDRCVSVAWAGFIIAAFLAIAGSRLAWSRTGAVIAFGLSLRIASGMAVAGLMIQPTKQHMLTAAYLRAATAVFVLIVWTLAILWRPRVYTSLREPITRLANRRSSRQQDDLRIIASPSASTLL